MSYVGIETMICPVCGKRHHEGAAVLLDTKLREDTFDGKPIEGHMELCDVHSKWLPPWNAWKRRQIEGCQHCRVRPNWQFCEEHQKQFDDGYVFVVGAKESDDRDRLQLEEADRTGEIVSIRRHVAEGLFGTLVPESGILFAAPEVIAVLAGMAEPEKDDESDNDGSAGSGDSETGGETEQVEGGTGGPTAGSG